MARERARSSDQFASLQLLDWVQACDDEYENGAYWWCGSDLVAPPGQPSVPGPMTWSVRYNTGVGFTEPQPWALPEGVVWLSRVIEGIPGGFVCTYDNDASPPSRNEPHADTSDFQSLLRTDAMVGNGIAKPYNDSYYIGCPQEETSPPPDWPGLPQEIAANLADWDGDGRVDYVDAKAGVWYRNIGDGFDEGHDLPLWFPEALGETWSMSFSMMHAGHPPEVTNGVTKNIPGSLTSEEGFRVMDLDRDGMLDVVYPEEYEDEFEVPLGWKGVRYGQYPRPGLLAKVTTETGAETTLSYVSSSYLDPSGDSAEDQFSPSRKDVVAAVTVVDPVTEQEARREFTYAGWKTVDGVSLGFATRETDDWLWSPDVAVNTGDFDPRGVQVAHTEITYWSSREHQVQDLVETWIDRDAAGAPHDAWVQQADLVRVARVDDTYVWKGGSAPGAGQIGSRWLNERDVTEYGETPGSSRAFEVKVLARNGVGLPTEIRHDHPASGQRDLTFWYNAWASDSSGSTYKPRRQ